MNFDKVSKIIADQLGVDVSEIHAGSRLIEDLHADSLDIVELVMDMEQEFDVEIPDDCLVKMKTVGDFLSFLEK